MATQPPTTRSMAALQCATSEEAAPETATPQATTDRPSSATDSGTRTPTTFKLPIFTPEEPELWLLQVECAFDVSGVVSDELRFKLVVANLPPTIAATVKDVIRTSKSFQTLSKALQDRLAQSRAERIKSLLSQQQLGDQKPSALLRSMRSELAATGDAPLETELFSTLFLQRLPQSVRAALALLPADSPLDKLADAADRYLEVSRSRPTHRCGLLHPTASYGYRSTVTRHSRSSFGTGSRRGLPRRQDGAPGGQQPATRERGDTRPQPLSAVARLRAQAHHPAKTAQLQQLRSAGITSASALTHAAVRRPAPGRRRKTERPPARGAVHGRSTFCRVTPVHQGPDFTDEVPCRHRGSGVYPAPQLPASRMPTATRTSWPAAGGGQRLSHQGVWHVDPGHHLQQ